MDVERGNRQDGRRASVAALVISLAAVLVAGGSFWYTVAHNRKMHEYRRVQDAKLEEYRRLAVEPFLGFDRILAPTQGYNGVGIYIHNLGNGTAVIQSGSITYSGEVLEHSAGLLAGIAELIADRNPGFPLVTAVGPRYAKLIQAGGKMLLLGVDADEFTPEVGAVLQGHIRRIGIQMWYRSQYEDAPLKRAELLPLPSGLP